MSRLLWNDDYLKLVADKLNKYQPLQFWGFNEDGEVVFSKRHKANFYSKFLPELGVFNLDMGLSVDSAETHTLVFVRGNRCQEIKPSTLQTIVGRVLKNLGDLGIELKAQMGMSNVFALNYLDGAISHLEDKTPFVDTATSAYRFFQNGWIEISKKSISPLRPYGEIPDGYIVWNSSIIPRNYNEEETLELLNKRIDYLVNEKKHPITKEIISKEELKSLHKELQKKLKGASDKVTKRPKHYADFITNLSRDNNGEVDTETLNRINLAIGYLCHRYNYPSNRKAVVVVDRFFSGAAKGSSNGRNGKGILIKSLRNLMDYCELSGKDFTKSSNDKMAFGSVRTHHELIHFDDAKSQTFDTERLFTQITGDFHIRGIGKDWVSIPAKNAPKIVITSNHPLKGKGSSYTERQFIVEVGHFYRLKLELEGLTPNNIHGGKHIADADTEDWNDDDWTEFHRYVFACIQLYLSRGGLPASHGSKDYQRAKLAEEFDSEEVLDWLIEQVEEYVEEGEEVFVELFYRNFRNAFPTETKRVSNTILWNWLGEVGKFQDVVFNPRLGGGLDKQRLNEARLPRWISAGMLGWKDRNGKVLGNDLKNDKVQIFKAVRKEKQKPMPSTKQKFEIPLVLPTPTEPKVGIETHLA